MGTVTADVVVAETGTDMSFPTGKHLASWAGTTPGLNELASKVEFNRTRSGNPYPQRALGARPCRSPERLAPTSTRKQKDRNPPRTTEGQRRLQTRCSSRSGTWESPAPSTKIPEPTTTPNVDQTEPGSGPSTSLEPWATASRSTKPRSAQRRAVSPYADHRVSLSTLRSSDGLARGLHRCPARALLLPRWPAHAHVPKIVVLRRP
ncbi:transposase [Geodermatophilus sp. URMC 64]